MDRRGEQRKKEVDSTAAACTLSKWFLNAQKVKKVEKQKADIENKTDKMK